MSTEKTISRLRARYERLKASVAAVGLVQQGSITERIDQRPDAQGRLRQRGPYYQWTFKRAGKTQTVNLTREQARQWRQALRNQRKLEKTMHEMRRVSLAILQATTQRVPTRRSRADRNAG